MIGSKIWDDGIDFACIEKIENKNTLTKKGGRSYGKGI
ncbi:hypothetical protein TDIS_1223 [Thermosulfurimonas dismutans]|uniref:Uncharacterized protein n=1 Tax=Thermosulfurimonas dismutans TaxID=999894 RepID=A0A179D4S2_9BACT|nr:hypothetical protein TDIS_1223 [Thermosulfurimonas dismutans]